MVVLTNSTCVSRYKVNQLLFSNEHFSFKKDWHTYWLLCTEYFLRSESASQGKQIIVLIADRIQTCK